MDKSCNFVLNLIKWIKAIPTISAPLLKLHIQLLDKSAIFPFEWPKDSQYPRQTSLKWKSHFYRLTNIMHTLYVIAITAKYLGSFSSLNVAGAMTGLLFTGGCYMTLAFKVTFHAKH